MQFLRPPKGNYTQTFITEITESTHHQPVEELFLLYLENVYIKWIIG